MRALNLQIQSLVAASNPSQRIKQAFERIKAWSAKDTALGSRPRDCGPGNRAESEPLWGQDFSNDDRSQILNRMRRMSGSPEDSSA